MHVHFLFSVACLFVRSFMLLCTLEGGKRQLRLPLHYKRLLARRRRRKKKQKAPRGVCAGFTRAGAGSAVEERERRDMMCSSFNVYPRAPHIHPSPSPPLQASFFQWRLKKKKRKMEREDVCHTHLCGQMGLSGTVAAMRRSTLPYVKAHLRVTTVHYCSFFFSFFLSLSQLAFPFFFLPNPS